MNLELDGGRDGCGLHLIEVRIQQTNAVSSEMPLEAQGRHTKRGIGITCQASFPEAAATATARFEADFIC
jgi:hypothetical protein